MKRLFLSTTCLALIAVGASSPVRAASAPVADRAMQERIRVNRGALETWQSRFDERSNLTSLESPGLGGSRWSHDALGRVDLGNTAKAGGLRYLSPPNPVLHRPR